MIRAIIRQGHIEPLDQLPKEWSEGQEVTVEIRDGQMSDREILKWHAEWKADCQDFSEADQAELDNALREIRQQGKEQMRKEMGL